MTEFLGERFGTACLFWPLLHKNATRGNLDRALVAARQAATGTELIVLLFSGHGLLESSGQAWGLFGPDKFDDLALARAVATFPAGTEFALVSDSCYGAGMFWAGRGSRSMRLKHKERVLYNRSHQWSADRVQASSERYPMVCMAAAYPTSTKVNTSESTLTRVVCDGSGTGATWKQLSKMVRAYKDDGRTFAFASRPRSVNGRAAFGR